MPRLPRGFVPACVVPLYAIGRTLHGALPIQGEAEFPLAALRVYGSSSLYAPLAKERHAYDLRIRAVEASPIGVELQAEARERPAHVPRLREDDDPERAARMRRPFLIPRIPGQVVEPRAQPAVGSDPNYENEGDVAPEPPRVPPKPLRSPTSIAVTLVPPYRDCLQTGRLSATACATGFAGLARPLPKGVEVSLPNIADVLGGAVRDALIEGAGSMVLVEERTGEAILIPGSFWRTDAAQETLEADEMVSMVTPEGREARGLACIAPQQLELVWLRARHRLFGAAPPPRLHTPGAALLERVSHELGYVDGNPTRWDLRVDHIAAWVELRWKEFDLGEYKNGTATGVARLIALPEHRTPGGTPTERTAQIEDWKRVYAQEAGKQYALIKDR